VAPNLTDLGALPAPTQNTGEIRTRDVVRDLHTTDKISSRTKWRQTRSGPGSVEEERRGGLKHVFAQLLPCIPVSKDVFRKALSALATIGPLDYFEHQFCHTL
jgi:hypothetical protein